MGKDNSITEGVYPTNEYSVMFPGSFAADYRGYERLFSDDEKSSYNATTCPAIGRLATHSSVSGSLPSVK